MDFAGSQVVLHQAGSEAIPLAASSSTIGLSRCRFDTQRKRSCSVADGRWKKDYIGRAVIRESIRRRPRGVQVYLVPYRALAQETYESFMHELQQEGLIVSTERELQQAGRQRGRLM